MSTTRKKPAPRSGRASSGVLNGTVNEVLTLAEAAAYLRLREADVIELHHSQGLPGRLAGQEWRFLKSALQLWLSTGTPTLQAQKESQLALAGKYKDDPDLMRICEEAMRQRGRVGSEGE